MATQIWQGTEGLWHNVEASKDQGQKMLVDAQQRNERDARIGAAETGWEQVESSAEFLSMRDSATSAMRGWEQQKPDGFTSELFLDQLILLES
jgi:hypothetical protein